MDEKKVREVIEWMKNERIIHKCSTYISPSIPEEQINLIEEYYNLAIEALEKQLPKKPTYEGDGYAPDGTFIWDEWLCPNCGSRYEVDYDDYSYCPNCGQRIDRKEEEEL